MREKTRSQVAGGSVLAPVTRVGAQRDRSLGRSSLLGPRRATPSQTEVGAFAPPSFAHCASAAWSVADTAVFAALRFTAM